MRPELPVVSFFCALLVLIPLPWYWRARNVNIISIIVWLFMFNMIRGINSIIWGGNVIVKIPVWCDITTKILIGANVGIPASILCTCRFLAQVASPHHKLQDANDRRRRRIIEFIACAVLPIIFMALHYIVQGHRFDILEDFGCQPAIYVSVAALFIIYLPPVLLAAGAMIYATIALRWFVHRRRQFQAVLQSSQSGLTTGRYLRLIALSLTEMTIVLAMSLYVLVMNVENIGLLPWVSWEYVHAEWMRVGQMARILAPPEWWDQFLFVWYIVPINSVIFFAFFGFGQEANAEYRRAFNWVKKNIFRIKPSQNSVLPVSRTGATLNSMMTTPTIIKLETETTVSGQEKYDDSHISNHTTSRPESPARDGNKRSLEIESRV